MKKLLLSILLFALGSNASFAQCAAMFNYSMASAGAPLVQFMDSSTTDSLGGSLSYQWDFGDGTPIDTGWNPIHQFPTYGVYNVCLIIVTGATSCTDTFCMSVNAQQPPPVITTWLMTDSMSMFACTAPDTVAYSYYIVAQNFTPPDTVFTVNMVWGDGSDSTWTLSGMNSGTQGTLYHTYLNAGTYTAQLTVTSNIGQVTSSSTGQPVIVTSTCGPVSGSVYNDLNNNCIFDMGEELQNVIVMIYNGTTLMGWTQSDANGGYSFNVPTGSTYEIRIQPNNGWYGIHTPSCPSSGILSSVAVPSTGNDFGVVCPPGADITGTVTTIGFRPGFTRSVCVNAYNVRCSTPSGTIELTLDSLLTPLPDTAGIGYTVNGQTVSFPINSPALNWNFCFDVLVSLNAQIGDTACIYMNIIVPGDSVPSNNTQTFCFPIRNSFDPNDKAAIPAGEGSQGLILPNTPLTYTIRFQNTGNDVAYNIYILDSLDSDLDVTSLEVMGASHPFTYSVLSGNILRFNFDNIMLEDSNANEPASHGYVTYKINQLSNVAQSAEIHNMASIFFDFNQPIYTNITLHTIDYFLSVPVNSVANNFSVFPNPAYDKCVVRFNDNSVKTIILSDALGKEVFRSNATSIIEINTSDFAVGMYTIRVEDGSTTSNSKLIIGMH